MRKPISQLLHPIRAYRAARLAREIRAIGGIERAYRYREHFSIADLDEMRGGFLRPVEHPEVSLEPSETLDPTFLNSLYEDTITVYAHARRTCGGKCPSISPKQNYRCTETDEHPIHLAVHSETREVYAIWR